METAIVSSKYQVVIPSEIRKQMTLRPGQKFWVLYENDSIKINSKKRYQ